MDGWQRAPGDGWRRTRWTCGRGGDGGGGYGDGDGGCDDGGGGGAIKDCNFVCQLICPATFLKWWWWCLCLQHLYLSSRQSCMFIIFVF